MCNQILKESKAKTYLQNLTDDEKKILKPYIYKQTKTTMIYTYGHINSGVIRSLIKYDVIYLAGAYGTLDEGSPYNISIWAWQYLNENLKLLDIDKK